MCVRDMFSHNSVNFKLKMTFQFHPQMKFGFSCINSSISTIFNRSKKMTFFIKLCDFCCFYIPFLNFWLQAYCYSSWPNRFGWFESNDSNHFFESIFLIGYHHIFDIIFSTCPKVVLFFEKVLPNHFPENGIFLVKVLLFQ